MNIKPLGKRVLIIQDKLEEKTKSGILLPGIAEKEEKIYGKVLAIGKEIKEIKIGDKIIFEKYSGTEITENDEVYLILEEKNILGIIE